MLIPSLTYYLVDLVDGMSCALWLTQAQYPGTWQYQMQSSTYLINDGHVLTAPTGWAISGQLDPVKTRQSKLGGTATRADCDRLPVSYQTLGDYVGYNSGQQKTTRDARPPAVDLGYRVLLRVLRPDFIVTSSPYAGRICLM